jgi:hypothetical protein
VSRRLRPSEATFTLTTSPTHPTGHPVAPVLSREPMKATHAMVERKKPEIEPPSEDRVETPYGTVCLVHLSSDCARVVSGRDVGWFKIGDTQLYATALFRLEGLFWNLDPRHSAVTSVVDDKAGEHVGSPLRDEALRLLEETFSAWRSARPDIAAQVAMCERHAEERRTEERIEELLDHVKALRGTLPGLRQARIEAEAEVERTLSSMAPGPTP